MKRYKVPDHFRRGLRQAIGVGIAVYVGYLLLHGAAVALHCSSCLLPQTWQQGTLALCGRTRALLRPGVTGVDEQHARQWLQGAKWAAITIVVVGSPVLGKVTQARCRRALHWSSSSVEMPCLSHCVLPGCWYSHELLPAHSCEASKEGCKRRCRWSAR